MANKNLNLTYKDPIVAVDGQTVSISEQGQVTIAFFQARSEVGQDLNADVVAAVRLHNLGELRSLQEQIKNTIKQHEDREP